MKKLPPQCCDNPTFAGCPKIQTQETCGGIGPNGARCWLGPLSEQEQPVNPLIFAAWSDAMALQCERNGVGTFDPGTEGCVKQVAVYKRNAKLQRQIAKV